MKRHIDPIVSFVYIGRKDIAQILEVTTMSMLPTGRAHSRSESGEWPASSCDSRLRVEVHFDGEDISALARDVRRGLCQRPKQLSPKYFYDDYGSQLFDAICDLPEYYLTRTEYGLLATVAAYPELEVHAVVGDYERHLEHLPTGRRRLVAFLGSSIGNFTPGETDRFLDRVAGHMQSGEHLLLGVDLVKDRAVLEAAYNDRAGVTAEFNRNILRVINRALDATFEPDAFAHVAFFNPEASQIEMHLRA